MKELYPGHLFELDNLKDPGKQLLQFRQDFPHPIVDGTSCQEVIRALIRRVMVLDEEKPWFGNHTIIIPGLRQSLVGFEARALIRKVEKGLKVENLPIADDGHLIFKESE